MDKRLSIPVAKPFLDEREAAAAKAVILSGWVTQGPRAREFEQKFAAYTGARHAVSVSSCTTALHLAILGASVSPGDEVICPSLSFIATANAVTYAGARPVFAEVDPRTLNLDAEDVAKKITAKTKAVLLVHQLGMPADIDIFRRLCLERGLKLIEDAACAVGSSYKKAKIGSHSEWVCFSFHPRKVITTGDGGMITTSSKEQADRLALLRHQGMSVSADLRHEAHDIVIEDYPEIGYNYRLTDIQAAIGIEQLARLDSLVAERRKIARRYDEAFREIAEIRIPHEPQGCVSNYQSYWIYLKPNCGAGRNELMRRLLKRGIHTRRGVMTAHREKAYRNRFGEESLPISEDLSDRSVILPLYVPMSDEEVDYVIRGVRQELTGR